MPVVTCKHCCASLSQNGSIWVDQGVWLRHLCTISPTNAHEPESIKNETPSYVQSGVKQNDPQYFYSIGDYI